jgi:hypothetical protein
MQLLCTAQLNIFHKFPELISFRTVLLSSKIYNSEKKVKQGTVGRYQRDINNSKMLNLGPKILVK